MTREGKRTAGVLLLVVAALLAVGAVVLWGKASDDAEADRLEAGYTQAITGEAVEADDANRVPSLALAGVAAVSFLGGVIFLAASGHDDG